MKPLTRKFYEYLITHYTFTVSQAKDIAKNLAKIAEKESEE